MKKIITGIKPTGSSMHLGNLMGAVLPFAEVAKGNDATIFIPDLHALNSVKNGEILRKQTYEIVIELMAILGQDIRIFRQSDIKGITELMWILMNVTPYSLMLRAHSFKDKEDRINEQERLVQFEKGRYTEAKKFPEVGAGLIKKINHEYGQNISMSNFGEFDKLILDAGKSIVDAELELEKMKNEHRDSINMGVFNYPILMAADIIGYDCEAVPVGKDQIQHLEMTRDIVRAFNKTYGKEVFIEPEAIVKEDVATLPGIDGRKMSKSYDNFIGVFDDEKTLKKRIMSITTGSEGIDEKKKNPDECNVFNLYKVFATPEQTAALRVKYESENIGFGYGHAKTELLTVLSEYLRPYREARAKLLEHPEIVEAKLADGAKIMNARLDAKMKVVKEVVGVN